MILAIAIISLYLINLTLAWSCAWSDAKAHNIERTYSKIVDWCINRGISIPYLINRSKPDKHLLYTLIRGCFWTSAFISIWLLHPTLNGLLWASTTILTHLIAFRAFHGSFYYYFSHKLDNTIYPNGFKTDSAGKTSKIDRWFEDDYSDRIILIQLSLAILFIQIAYLLH